jgi:hypothetical protein
MTKCLTRTSGTDVASEEVNTYGPTKPNEITN